MKSEITQAISDMEDMFYDIIPSIESLSKDSAAYDEITRINELILNHTQTTVLNDKDAIKELNTLTQFNTRWFPTGIDPKEQQIYRNILNKAQLMIK